MCVIIPRRRDLISLPELVSVCATHCEKSGCMSPMLSEDCFRLRYPFRFLRYMLISWNIQRGYSLTVGPNGEQLTRRKEADTIQNLVSNILGRQIQLLLYWTGLVSRMSSNWRKSCAAPFRIPWRRFSFGITILFLWMSRSVRQCSDNRLFDWVSKVGFCRSAVPELHAQYL